MTTLQKIQVYRDALTRWSNDLQRLGKGSVEMQRYPEPTPQDYHLRSPAELVVAKTIREQVMKKGQ